MWSLCLKVSDSEEESFRKKITVYNSTIQFLFYSYSKELLKSVSKVNSLPSIETCIENRVYLIKYRKTCSHSHTNYWLLLSILLLRLDFEFHTLLNLIDLHACRFVFFLVDLIQKSYILFIALENKTIIPWGNSFRRKLKETYFRP